MNGPDAGKKAKQKIEIEFWRDSKEESPESNSLSNIIDKVSDAGVLLDCLDRHKSRLSQTGRVLELGGGQGWASCVYKRVFPGAFVIATDISEYAVMSLPKWEKIFDVKIDGSYACTSYGTNEKDSSVDQVFCYAAAHHFLAHRRTLTEISRILKPGGAAIYFYEPATSGIFYPLAFWRVNRKRPEVPEDVLIASQIVGIARTCGLEPSVDFYPSLKKRGVLETLYYFCLARLPFLQRLLPCTANFIFTKRA